MLHVKNNTRLLDALQFEVHGTLHRDKVLIIHSNGICYTGLLTACEQDQDGTEVAVCTVKTPDYEQRNCPKHVQFHSKNKFEKLCVYLVLL